MTKYSVYVHKTITEYWEVEAENEGEARIIYDVTGVYTGEKEHEKDIDVYED